MERSIDMTDGNESTNLLDFGVSMYTGLTKREYFAALALQGVLASGSQGHMQSVEAVYQADRLIEELNK